MSGKISEVPNFENTGKTAAGSRKSVGKKSKVNKKTKEKKLKMFINPNSKKTIKHSQDPSLCTFGGGPDKENDEVDKFEISCLSL